MKSIGTLYIDCPYQEKDDAFTVSKELTEEEYVKMLRDYSNTIEKGTPKFHSSHGIKSYEIYEEKNEEINYSSAKSRIYDISGSETDIHELYRIQNKGMGVLIFEIFENQMEEQFESEFKFWKRDSMNINNDKSIDMDQRINFLPIKNLKFEIDEHMFLLSGCKMYCDYDKYKFALIIQSVKEI